MSAPAYEQLTRFPLRLYDAVIEDTMAIKRATIRGGEALRACIEEQREIRMIRRLNMGFSAVSSEVNIIPVAEPEFIEGQLGLGL